MEQKTIIEQLGGTYSQQGDYLLPNLTLPDTKKYVIGKYGHLRQRYLKKHRPILYTNLLTDYSAPITTPIRSKENINPPEGKHRYAARKTAIRARNAVIRQRNALRVEYSRGEPSNSHEGGHNDGEKD